MARKQHSIHGRGPGRPQKYSTRYDERVYELLVNSQKALTKKALAELLGVSFSQFNEWTLTKLSFSEAINKGRLDFQERTHILSLNSLPKLITGYDVEEKKVTRKRLKSGELEVIEEQVTTKHVGPNLGAVIFAATQDPMWINTQKVNAEVSIPQLNIEVNDNETKTEIEKLGAADNSSSVDANVV